MKVELEYRNGKVTSYVYVDIDSKEILVDISLFPKSCFFYASYDGIECWLMKVGEEAEEQRIFLDIEWLINKWNGPKDIVEALKINKEKVLAEIPNLREKYLVS